MITRAYRAIKKASYFRTELRFHPTSENVARVVPELPSDVVVISTEEIFKGIDYQHAQPFRVIWPLAFREEIDS